MPYWTPKTHTLNSSRIGPCVAFGNALFERGIQIYMNGSVVCRHLTVENSGENRANVTEHAQRVRATILAPRRMRVR